MTYMYASNHAAIWQFLIFNIHKAIILQICQKGFSNKHRIISHHCSFYIIQVDAGLQYSISCVFIIKSGHQYYRAEILFKTVKFKLIDSQPCYQ
jgi:hypothetical protein